ncbi:hypothetical protein ACFL3M_02525 [Patescibacteria group bacterium]
MELLEGVPDYEWIPGRMKSLLSKDLDNGCEVFWLKSRDIDFSIVDCQFRSRQAIISVKDGDIQTAVFSVGVNLLEQDSKSKFKSFLESILKDCVRFVSVNKMYSSDRGFSVEDKVSFIFGFQDIPFDFYQGVSEVAIYLSRGNDKFIKNTVFACDHHLGQLALADFFSEGIE